MGPRIALAVLAVAHIGFGIWALGAPQQVAAMAELQPLTAGAMGELRAVYGGLIIAMGAAIARGAMGGANAGVWLTVVALAYGGLASGRLVSLLADGASGYTLLAMGLETLLAAFVAWTAWLARLAARVEPRPTNPPAAPS